MTRNGDQSVKYFAFETLTTTNTAGAAIRDNEYADRTVHIKGTFGGTTVVWEGSNDGVTYKTLTDPQGNSISTTAEIIEQVIENTTYSRPRLTGGDGTTDIDVFVICRRPNTMRT